MKIPNSVQVDRETYKVVYGDPDQDGCGESTGDGSLGSCSTTLRVIKLRPSLLRDKRLRIWTFFHELAHAMNWEYGLRLNHAQIDRLGRALAYLAEDNGMAFATRALAGR